MKRGEVEGYRYNRKEMMIYNPDKKAVGATTAGDRIYFSDIYKTYPNVYLEGTMGYEFIHAYHHMKFGSSTNASYSEYSAYQYSIDFSLKNRNVIDVSNLNFYRSQQLNFRKDKTGRYDYKNIPGF